jgi:hypothetical protein
MGGVLIACAATGVLVAHRAATQPPTTRFVVLTRDVDAGAAIRADDLGTVAAELPDDLSVVDGAQRRTSSVGCEGATPVDGPAPHRRPVRDRPVRRPTMTEVVLDLSPAGAVRHDHRRRPGRGVSPPSGPHRHGAIASDVLVTDVAGDDGSSGIGATGTVRIRLACPTPHGRGRRRRNGSHRRDAGAAGPGSVRRWCPMTGDGQYVLVGVARARERWSSDLARWATSGAAPIEFVKCLTADEANAVLGTGRRASALLLDARGPGIDRDLIATAADLGTPTIVVSDRSVHRDWDALGCAAVVDHELDPATLLRCWPGTPSRSTGRVVLGGPAEARREPARRVLAVVGPGGTGVDRRHGSRGPGGSF